MKIHQFLLLSCLLLFPMVAVSEDDRKAVVVLGDSLSAAFGMQMDESWPSLLQQRLDEHGYDYRVFNSSITGDTTQGGLRRLPGVLSRNDAVVVILELGGNDGLRGLPLNVTRDNLAQMIETSQAAGASVLLAEIMIPPNYGKSYTDRFTKIYADLQQQYGIELLPFILEDIALQEGLMQADGIHPTAAAQPLILDKVWTRLEPLLPGDPSGSP